MNELVPILLLLFAYLTGSIPFGLLLGKSSGIDVRRQGSGNIGATNVSRLLGKKLGLLTLAADIGKAILPMLLARWLLSRTIPDLDPERLVALCGASAFLGHLFPVYLKFRGGKGVATALGVFLLLEPLALGISLGLFIGAVWRWDYVAVGSLTAVTAMPVLIWLLGGSTQHALLALGIGILIWFKHSDNIARLLRGEEKSWRGKSLGPGRKA
jgi:glycerol-3-phosphate acyltransferase PlsY